MFHLMSNEYITNESLLFGKKMNFFHNSQIFGDVLFVL